MRFSPDAHKLPARPCVWCGLDCWDSWQLCSRHYRLNPWHRPSWWKMLARLRLHESWASKYVARHPEHAGKVYATLRAERLRWHWGGRHGIGWRPDFALWGLTIRKNPNAPRYEWIGGVCHRLAEGEWRVNG